MSFYSFDKMWMYRNAHNRDNVDESKQTSKLLLYP